MASKKKQHQPKLSLLGYKVGTFEMALACNHPHGVVLSIGDMRVDLNREQFDSLYSMLQEFNYSETEL